MRQNALHYAAKRIALCGKTPLHYAAKRIALCGKTPLHYAAKRHCIMRQNGGRFAAKYFSFCFMRFSVLILFIQEVTDAENSDFIGSGVLKILQNKHLPFQL